MNRLGLLVIIAAAAFVAYFIFFSKSPAKKSGDGDTAYNDLLRWTRGDREQAERLITLEAKRHPTLDRAAHIRAAIERFQRDNR
jgi:hypothetical protein